MQHLGPILAQVDFDAIYLWHMLLTAFVPTWQCQLRLQCTVNTMQPADTSAGDALRHVRDCCASQTAVTW